MYFLKYLFSLILVGHQCDYVNGGIIDQLEVSHLSHIPPPSDFANTYEEVHWRMIFGYEANLF